MPRGARRAGVAACAAAPRAACRRPSRSCWAASRRPMSQNRRRRCSTRCSGRSAPSGGRGASAPCSPPPRRYSSRSAAPRLFPRRSAPHQHSRVVDVASASRGALSATVRYGGSSWGTHMSVQVTGLKSWTSCKFYVHHQGRQEAAGRRLAGRHRTRARSGTRCTAQVREPNVTGFQLTTSRRSRSADLRRTEPGRRSRSCGRGANAGRAPGMSGAGPHVYPPWFPG